MKWTVLLAMAVFGFGAEHPDLNGVWKTTEGSQTVTIHQKEDAVEIVESGKETATIQCNTNGQACKTKGVEVTAWYNGGTLVVMEQHGTSRVVKKRYKVLDDGKGVEEEIVRIVPAGATEKVSLVRQTGS